MNYMQIDEASISNGLGFRVVLWCAGCTQGCKGCFNAETWDFNAGKLFDDKAKQHLFDQLEKPYIKGITFSGGHPLEPENIETVIALCKEIKEKYPTKDIWVYTGHTWSELYYHNKLRILLHIDVLIDGPYIEEERDVTLPFRGSKNQRLIDVPKTLERGEVVLLDEK